MDPTAGLPGTRMNFTSNDLLAMDVIGWNLTSNIQTSSVPLPSSAGLLGLGLIGFIVKRKKSKILQP